jgi:hypothetical protein
MLEKMLTDPTLPERYRLAPDDLSQMTMADASVAAKKADNYLVREAEKNLLAAADTLPTTVIYPDKARWLAPDDVIVNPDHRAVVRALGKKGGWCTKNENEVDMYGANNNRLNILMGPNKKPSVQVTTTAQDRTAEDWFNTLSDEQMEVGEATYAQYLRENNIPYMTMGRFEREYGLEQVFMIILVLRIFKAGSRTWRGKSKRPALSKGEAKANLLITSLQSDGPCPHPWGAV